MWWRSKVLKETSERYMYQDPILWVWLEIVLIPKKYTVLSSKTTH